MKIIFSFICISIFLFGCQSSTLQSKKNTLELQNKNLVNNTSQNPQVAYLIKEGLELIDKNDLNNASKTFNAALQLDMTNSHLQFLNANTYHVMALQYDTSYFDLAVEGYKLSINLDNTNWYPRYYLGLLYLDKKDYSSAQDYLADALLYNTEDPDIIYNFIVASYYAQDPISAAGGIELLKTLEPKSERLARVASMVHSSLDNQEEANYWLSSFSLKPDDPIVGRSQDWKNFYQRIEDNLIINASDTTEESNDNGNTDDQNETVESDSVGLFEEEEDMLIADVVIVTSEDKQIDSTGVNLLSGLTLQLGDGTSDAFNLVDTGNVNADSTTTITRRLTIPYITYTLNIINAHSERSEILARPSLVASEGILSTFFAGENITASAESSNTANNKIQVNMDLGVKLSITPTKLEEDIVELTVQVERNSLKSNSANVNFTYQIRQAKTNVEASVKMRRGDTLILSGLSERETELQRDGVPLLQDLPIIQYFFSRQVETDINKSVLVLITPRLPQYTYRTRETRMAIAKQRGEDESIVLKELKGRYSDWFKPYPNWTAVYNQLQENSLYREFRTGDVKFDKWDSQTTHKERLNNIFKYLYF